MHPPFGFALFYLRSVAPNKPYMDKLTRKEIAPVTTGQIYWGAVPFVVIQIIMVGLIIAFPGIVSRDVEKKIDLDKVKIEMPADPGFGPGVDPFAPPANDPFAPPANDPFAPPAGDTTGAAPSADPGAAPETAPSADEEQKKIDELFNPKK
jgi:GntP family gluconate:H+ symporter